MFSNYLSSIEGVDIYPIISFLIFFVFFVGLTVWTFKADKKYLKKMSKMPLESSNMNKEDEN